MALAEDEMDARNGALVLSQYGWLSRMPADFRTAILRICVWQNYEAGAPLFAAGDPPGGIFGIADGSVGTSTLLGAPDSPMVHIARRGFWSGMGSVLSGEPRRMSASAITEALVANVPLPALHSLLSERPEWWQHIGQLALSSIDIIGNGFVDLMIRDSGRRCAAILLRLCECRFNDAADMSREVMVTQEQIADMANLSRATVNRILRGFAKQRLIELRYRSIFVAETKRLRKLANGE
jgi:CRP/FNR family transcriptional regulator, cyclic AMP receptor protein